MAHDHGLDLGLVVSWWALWLKRNEKAFGVWVEYTVCCRVTFYYIIVLNQKVVFAQKRFVMILCAIIMQNEKISEQQNLRIENSLLPSNPYRNPVLYL